MTMTKQEYQSSTAIIIADNKLGHTNRMIELRYIDAEYITSMEAENVEYAKAVEQLMKDNEALEAENAALTLLHTQATDQMIKMQNRVHELEAENKLLNAAMDKAIEIFADDGAIACPALKVDYECNDGYGCNNLDIVNTSACWREFLMQETADGATQTPLHVSDATQKE